MNIKNEILRLKREKDVCIIAHSYQTGDILEIADFTGDSYALSVKAAQTKSKTILMCGVRFMAETAKILSPDKRVIIANADAGCPMAEQLTKEDVEALKVKYPGYAVACYINTSASLKTVCDICVTSSSAVKILGKYENDNIIFIPDRNLGSYIKEKLPDKNIILVNGCCPVHAAVTEDEAVAAKKAYPGCPLLVHPECVPDVLRHADFIGSTSEIMNYAVNSDSDAFIIGTELAISQHLQKALPEKKFYMLSERLVCPDMKLTALKNVYDALDGGRLEIVLDAETITKAAKCINEMIRLG